MNTNIKTFEDKKFGLGTFKFEAREDTYDESYVIVEVLQRGCYLKHFSIFEDDVVLDLGGHIGTFACQAARMGATVHSYEMDKGNYTLLKRNLRLNKCTKNVTVHNLAVVDDCEDGTIEYGRNTKKNTGSHSLYVKGGQREVLTAKTIGIDQVLGEVEPNFIKMDVEGAEKILLPSVLEYEPDYFVMEYHHNIIRDLKHYTKVYKQIRNRYDDVIAHNPDKVGKNWQTMIYAWNES